MYRIFTLEFWLWNKFFFYSYWILIKFLLRWLQPHTDVKETLPGHSNVNRLCIQYFRQYVGIDVHLACSRSHLPNTKRGHGYQTHLMLLKALTSCISEDKGNWTPPLYSKPTRCQSYWGGGRGGLMETIASTMPSQEHYVCRAQQEVTSLPPSSHTESHPHAEWCWAGILDFYLAVIRHYSPFSLKINKGNLFFKKSYEVWITKRITECQNITWK